MAKYRKRDADLDLISHYDLLQLVDQLADSIEIAIESFEEKRVLTPREINTMKDALYELEA